jgi:hypothetical protein
VDLTLATYGFFLYPTKNGQCRAIVAPRVDGPLLHECTLLIDGTVLHATGFGVTPGPISRAIPISGSRVLLGAPNAATLSRFALVPDFGQLKCGAVLDPDWLNSRLGHVDALVMLNGGTLTAFADDFTNDQTYTWDDCQGGQVNKPISSLIVYEQPEWDGVVRIESLASSSGPGGEIRFAGARTTLAILHDLRPKTVGSEVDIDLAHAAATVKLCAKSGTNPVQHGTKVNSTSTHTSKSMPSHIKSFLKQSVGISTTKAGRPNCGARQMAE